MVSPMRRQKSVFAATAAALLAIVALVMWPVPSKAAERCGPDPGHTADARVILQNTSYSPQTVTLTVAGQSVCWEHLDGQIPHSITSDKQPGAPDYFDFPGAQCTPTSPPADCFQQGDQPWKLILNSPGEYPYHCKIHPTMTGKIVVAGSGGTTATTKPPAATSTTKPAASGATTTTVGSITQDTSTTTIAPEESSTTSSSTTSSTLDLTTQTTSSDSALGDDDDDDDEPSRVLKTVGVVLLLAVIAALIPAWRRLT